MRTLSPGRPIDTFHVMRMIVKRKLENDDVAAADARYGRNFVPGAAAAKYKFVHQQMVADQQRRLHRLRGNLESLHDERGAKKREQNGDQQRFGNIRRARCAVLSMCGRSGSAAVILSGISGGPGEVVSTSMNSFQAIPVIRYADFAAPAHASALLRFLFTAAFGGRKPRARMPNFHFECLSGDRAGFAVHTIFHRHADRAVAATPAARTCGRGALSRAMRCRARVPAACAAGKTAAGQTRIQINGAENCFENVSEQPALIAAASFLFAAPSRK